MNRKMKSDKSIRIRSQPMHLCFLNLHITIKFSVKELFTVFVFFFRFLASVIHAFACLPRDGVRMCPSLVEPASFSLD
jgi:hypothetical protein